MRDLHVYGHVGRRVYERLVFDRRPGRPLIGRRTDLPRRGSCGQHTLDTVASLRARRGYFTTSRASGVSMPHLIATSQAGLAARPQIWSGVLVGHSRAVS